MRPGARMKSAVEVLDEILLRHRPAANALTDWGKAHRFAGSGDRSAIGNLVYDVLRHKLSLAAQMESDDPRALVIAAAPRALALSHEAVALACDGSAYALEPLTGAEQANLARALPDDTPEHVAGDLPEWLMPSLRRAFGEGIAAEGKAMAQRAPVDLRVNTLKADRDKVLKSLAAHAAVATARSPIGVRIPAPEGPQRAPNVEAEAAHGKGWYEVQDEGSQLAALLAGARPRAQVLDLCAGAGGKTLALAAQMQNTGQIYAWDTDKQQLRPIFERVKRAGVRNVQLMNAGDRTALEALGPRFDVVLVDAPCTGSGTWRRRPDSKWRLKPSNIPERIAEQKDALDLAATLVKPGGALVYVTCSILPEENEDQVEAFLGRHAGFAVEPYHKAWATGVGGEPPASADGSAETLLLTPASHGTDGFFVARLARTA